MDELDDLLNSLQTTQVASGIIPVQEPVVEKIVPVKQEKPVSIPQPAPTSAGNDMSKVSPTALFGKPIKATPLNATSEKEPEIPSSKPKATSRAWAEGFSAKKDPATRFGFSSAQQILIAHSQKEFENQNNNDDKPKSSFVNSFIDSAQKQTEEALLEEKIANMNIRHIPGTGESELESKKGNPIFIVKSDGTKVEANSVFIAPKKDSVNPISVVDQLDIENVLQEAQEAESSDITNSFKNLRKQRRFETGTKFSNEPIGVCSACNKSIFGNCITSNEGKLHIDCFVCSVSTCKRKLGGLAYFLEKDDLYCENCYHENYSPRCAYCDKPVKDRLITALGKSFHPEHFFCSQCGKVFGPDEAFLEANGKAYCEEDFGVMFAGVCAKCKKPLLGDFVATPANKWHKDCFDCIVCHVPLMANGFFEHEGNPYCETHYVSATSKICVACGNTVIGRFVRAGGLQYHPSCFRCAFCKSSLDTSTIGVGWGAQKQMSEGGFKVHSGKSYCTKCFLKFYG